MSSLSFLPSYLRNWIDAECNSPEKDDLFDFQETTEEKDDWVVINYRKTTNEENKNELNDLLSQYVIVKNHAQENETENNNKISKKDDSTEKPSKYSDDMENGKRAKRWIYEQNKLRSMEVLRATRRYSPILGVMPQHFPKIALERIEEDFRTADRLLLSNQTNCQCPIKSEECVVENRIVPYYGNKQHAISSSEILELEVFHQLAKITCTTVIHCDSSQSNPFPVVQEFSLERTFPTTPTYQVVNACNLDSLFTTTKPTKHLQLMSPVQLYGVNNSTTMMSTKDPCNYSSFLKNVCDDVILQDYRESPSKMFSINPFESALHARLFSTKAKFENLLRSIMVLHFILNKKLESWKSFSSGMFRNFPFANQTSKFRSTAASTVVPQYDNKPSFATTPETYFPAKSFNLTTKQLRRQNRRANRSCATTSNRQRGMKHGRFQNNVGRRESWRC